MKIYLNSITPNGKSAESSSRRRTLHLPVKLAVLSLIIATQCTFISSVRAGAGDLFVTDLETNSILAYSPDGTVRTFATGLDSPQGLAFDSVGNLYVADGGSGTIFKYTTDGTRSVFASGLANPSGLSFATASKQLLVAEHDANKITSLLLDGNGIGSVSIPSPQTAVFRNLTEDQEGSALNTTWMVSNTDAASSFLQEDISGDGSNVFLTGLDPRDVAFTSFPLAGGFDTAFVSSGSGTIFGITTTEDSTGGFTNTIETFVTGLGDLHGLAFRPALFSSSEGGVGDLFAADTANGQIHKVSVNKEKSVFATGGQPNYLTFETALRGKLQNISTRAQVLTGDNVLIAGFIVTGDNSRQVVVRAIGPSLAGMGVTGALSDPVLELHYPDGTVKTNDNWKDNSPADQTAITTAELAPPNDLESALIKTLSPGAYTVVIRGVNDATGVGLAEAYDLDTNLVGDANVSGEQGNISTRSFVGTGDNVMIAGFIIGPSENGRVLVRGIGPELAARNVPDPLMDPTLELHDADGVLISTNDNWQDTAEGEISATGIPPTAPSESAILANLRAGAYTAIVSGANNSTGVGLVEVYHLQ